MLKRFLFIIAILVVLVFMVAGCGSSKQDTSSTKADTAANPTQQTNNAKNEQVFEGWLMDKMSSDKKEPKKKTKECLLMPEMEASGYGVLVKQQDNTYKFFKFDETGHKLAKENILNKTTKTENIKITVKGVVEGENLKVSSIVEK